MLAATKYLSRKANTAVGVASMRLGIMLYFAANTLICVFMYIVVVCRRFSLFAIQPFDLLNSAVFSFRYFGPTTRHKY